MTLTLEAGRDPAVKDEQAPNKRKKRQLKKRRPQWQPPPIDPAAIPTHPDKLLSFHEWCFLNKISASTGRRICARGEGPVILRLSKQRIGITVAANRRWQETRARKRTNEKTKSK